MFASLTDVDRIGSLPAGRLKKKSDPRPRVLTPGLYNEPSGAWLPSILL
jgi:hypothetical protein